nr:hypothetical protein [Sporosarcina quadrami]
MKIGKLIKTAIKWAPVVYPIVYKLISSKNKNKSLIKNAR